MSEIYEIGFELRKFITRECGVGNVAPKTSRSEIGDIITWFEQQGVAERERVGTEGDATIYKVKPKGKGPWSLFTPQIKRSLGEQLPQEQSELNLEDEDNRRQYDEQLMEQTATIIAIALCAKSRQYQSDS
jgi:hypothetical protein